MLELDATAQAALVASGEVSARELVDASIAAALEINPAINGIIHERFERARAQADAGGANGQFRGVPMVIKDLVAKEAGEPYHAGTRALKAIGYRASYDTELVRRFRAAGFINIGRTNTPEFGSTITTEPLAYGPTRNPWNLDHTVGGSSGGSAACVASGIVAVGHANDGGGSIRVPAANCGLVGLKPSRGRVSHAPNGESWGGATIEGAVTRSVRDAAAVLDAISGYCTGDSAVATPFARPLADEVGAPVGRLRVGLWTHPADGSPGDPECAEAVTATGKLLESLGHDVAIAHPPALGDDIGRAFVTLVAVGATQDLNEIEALIGRRATENDIEGSNLRFGQIGRGVSAVEYVDALATVNAWRRRVMAWWHPTDGLSSGFDVLCSPVVNGAPAPIGWLSDDVHANERVRIALKYTSQFNLTGQPAVSLPLAWSASGLPIGVQFVGGFETEPLLVRLAAQLEEAAPWRHRRPPVFAGNS